MPFEQDTATAVATGEYFGRYVRTFRSDREQVVAHLFEQDGWLIAHIMRPTGLEIEDITDRYITDLWEFARQQGFEHRFRIVYVE
jgi:hypothetical protein